MNHAPILPSTGGGHILTLAEGFMLVGWWKAVLLIIPFILWAKLVTTVYDKHAARFHLGRQKWNTIHLLLGLAAFLVAIFMPIAAWWGFLVALAAMIIVLGIDIVAYPMIANRDDRVPENHRLTLDFSSWKQAKEAKAAAKKAGSSEMVVTGAGKRAIPVPDKDQPEFAVRVAAEEVLIEALQNRSTRVDVLPAAADGSQYGVRHMVDAIPQAVRQIPGPEAVRIMDFWKQAAGLDIEDRRRKLTGDVNIDYAGANHKVRLTSVGGKGGMRLAAVFDPEKQVRRTVDELGMLPKQLEELKKIAEERQGVVLLACPSGNGGTTMLYSVVKLHDAYTENVQTLEVDVQDALEGVKQVKWDPFGADQYSKLLRSTLRRDPDVVGVAELPDADTAKEACSGDTDRSRVYLLMSKAGNSMEAIALWTKAVGDAKKSSDALHGVVAGKLIRKLCSNCRVAYQPTEEMLRRLGLPSDKVKSLFKKGGQVMIKNKPEECPVCGGSGYFGVEGVYEVYPIGPEERALIEKGDASGLRASLRQKGLPAMQQAALRKAVEGVTSVEEVLRVTAEGQKKSSRATAEAS